MAKRPTKKQREAKLTNKYDAVDAIEKDLNEHAMIRACPWCATRPEVCSTHPGTGWVECRTCGGQGPHQYDARAWRRVARRAVDAWNAMHKLSWTYGS